MTKKLISNKSISSAARNLSLLLSAFCLFSGCDCKDCIQNDPGTLFNVTPNHLLFTEDALQRTFSVSSSMDWTLITMPEGFTYSVTKGKPGLTVVTVIMTDFDGIEPVTVWAQASNGDTKPVVLEYIWPELENDPDTKDPDVLPAGNVIPYIGAFWRAEETGERIIRIKNMHSLGNDGAWTASVTWLDGRWGNDRPVLGNATLAELTARGIYSDAPGNAEDYPVTTRTTKVIGNTSEGAPDIIFRIGVTQPFTEDKGFIPDGPTAPNYTTTWPARYGIITVTYNNNTKSFKMYLRHGEGADYVMRPEDAINSGGMSNPAGPGARPSAVRFSPYNLTDPNHNTELDFANMTTPATGLIGPRGGAFVDYPTQAGYFFQFNFSTRAFHPSSPYTIANWGADIGPAVWSATRDETCPIGWRRPDPVVLPPFSDDSDSALGLGSELRQSLWLNPQTGNGRTFTNNLDNTIFGYYADGFFDRREIVTPAGSNPHPASAVSIATHEVAYMGAVCFNPMTNASLFLPITGLRHSDGTLIRAGSVGRLSSAGVNNEKAYTFTTTLIFDSLQHYLVTNSRLQGHIIRCVRE